MNKAYEKLQNCTRIVRELSLIHIFTACRETPT